jgi:hypothetical protein
MERAMVWFKCAAMHDPVRPVQKRPAIVGWEAKQRQVDLVIERAFNGPELLRRMKGWITVDVEKAIDILEAHGRLRLLDERDLVVETPDSAAMDRLASKLGEAFGEEAWIEPVAKSRLA